MIFSKDSFLSKPTPDFSGLNNYLLEKLKLELPGPDGKMLLSEQTDIVLAIDTAMQHTTSSYYRSEISRLSSGENLFKLIKIVAEADRKKVLTRREISSYFIKGILKNAKKNLK